MVILISEHALRIFGYVTCEKIGIKEGYHIALVSAPEYYMELVTDLPVNLFFDNDGDSRIDIIHFFHQKRRRV